MAEERSKTQVSGHLLFPLSQYQFWKCRKNSEDSWRNDADYALRLVSQNHEAAGNQPCASKPLKTSGEWTLKPSSSQEALPGCRKPNHRRRNSKALFHHLPLPTPTLVYAGWAPLQRYLQDLVWASGHVGLLVWSGEAEGDLRQGNRGHQSGAEGLSPRPSQRCLCRLWPVWREEEPAAQRTPTHCFQSQRPASGTDTATAQLGSVFDGS